jgi:hypothetical protein
MASVYYLYPTTVFSNPGWASQGTGTQNDVYGSFDEDVGYYNVTLTNPSAIAAFTWNLTDFLPITTGISSIVVGSRMWNKNGGYYDGEIVVRVGGVNYLSSWVGGSTGGYTNYEATWTVNPATTSAWTVAELNALIAGSGYTPRAGTKEYRITAIYVRVAYAGAPALAPQARDIASRRVFDLGANKALVSLSIPLETGKLIDVLDDLPVVHWAGPHDSAAGWQQKLWEARLTKVYSISVNPNDSSVSVQLRDRRPALCLMQDTAWSLKSSSAEALGIARFNKGCTRAHTRTGDTIVLAPGSLKLTKVLEHAEKYGADGQLHEESRNNEIPQSGFKNGAANTYTGWSQVPNGTGASFLDYSIDDEDLIFEPLSTGVLRAVKITQGNPIGANSHRLTTAAATVSFAANSILRVSGWHKDLTASEGAWWRLVRQNDFWNWRDSDSTWIINTNQTWNRVPYSATWTRFVSKAIDIGGTAATMFLHLGGGGSSDNQPATAGQVNVWGHVQLETGGWASSDILCEATSVTRNVSKLTISNNTAARCWNAAQGAFVCEVIPQWSTAELGNKNATIMWIDFGASNWEWIYYDGTNDRWVFERRVAGTTSRATKSATLVAGTIYKVGCRWTGSNAELDLAAFTASIFIDDVQGTDVVTAAAPTETATSDMEIGSKAALEHWNGVVRLAHSYQYAPTSAEMARLPA